MKGKLGSILFLSDIEQNLSGWGQGNGFIQVYLIFNHESGSKTPVLSLL